MARPFLGAFEGMYLDGTIYYQPEWHDCVAFDFARKKFQERGMRVFNLTPREYPTLHPMSASALAKYIDHTKGNRKKLGYSPEYTNRSRSFKQQERHPVYNKFRSWTKSDPPLPNDEEIAELEGYSAYEDGKREEDCPYKEEKFSVMWRAGWQRHYQEFLKENAYAGDV
jgi:ribosome modulation factor